MDESGSISASDFSRAKSFVNQLALDFRIGSGSREARFALVKYSTKVNLNTGWMTSGETVERTVSGLPKVSGLTYTGAALVAAAGVFDTSGARGPGSSVPKIVLLITDGAATDSPRRGSDLLKRMGVTVFSVGVGRYGSYMSTLTQVASSPSRSRVFGIQSYTALVAAFDSIAGKVCTVVELADPQPPPPPLPQCTSRLDLVLLVDTSASIGTASGGWDSMVDFASRVVSSLNIGTSLSSSRVGMATFGSGAKRIFSLGTHASAQAAASAVKAVTYVPASQTNTRSGFELVRDIMFASGARPASYRVPRVVLLLTDGKYNPNWGSMAAYRSSDQNPANVAKQLRASGVRIMAVGVKGASSTELAQVASSPTSSFVKSTSSFRTLPAIVSSVAPQVCSAAVAIQKAPLCRRQVDLFFVVGGAVQVGDFGEFPSSCSLQKRHLAAHNALQHCSRAF